MCHIGCLIIVSGHHIKKSGLEMVLSCRGWEPAEAVCVHKQFSPFVQCGRGLHLSNGP